MVTIRTNVSCSIRPKNNNMSIRTEKTVFKTRDATISMLFRAIATVIGIPALFVMPSLTGCTTMLAEKLAKTSNHGKTVEQLGELDGGELKKLQIDQQYRVEATSPPASLHVGVIHPKKEWTIEPGTYFYDLFQKAFQEEAKQNPETNIQKKYYWQNIPRSDKHTILSITEFGLFFSAKQRNKPGLWKEPKGTIVGLHGFRTDKSVLALGWGQVLAAYGYRVVLVDLRGHGLSTGDYHTFGRVESEDISRVIDSLESKGWLQGKCVLMGGSYGAAIAIQTAAKDRRIDAVIAMEPYTSLKAISPDLARQTLGLLAVFLGKNGAYEVVDKAGKIADFDPDTPLDVVGRIQVPVLFIHGKEDQLIPYQHSQKLKDAARYGTLLLLENRDHVSLVFKDMYPLKEKIIHWIESEENIKTNGSP